MVLASRAWKVGVLIVLFIMLQTGRQTVTEYRSLVFYISFQAQLSIKIQVELKPELSADFEY